MAGSNGRAKRHFFGGTGLYIALFLGVTALAVAGYWTLLPKNTTDKDAENVSSQVELPLEDETPQMPEAELPQEAAKPAKSPVTPPPRATRMSERVRPFSARKFRSFRRFSPFLLSSPAGKT